MIALLPFSDIEISNPKFEFDGLRFLGFQSASLKRRGEAVLFVPPGQPDDANLPIVLLLHGVLAMPWSWALCAGAHRTAQSLIDAGEMRPCVLAMPSDGMAGQGTGYIPAADANYETWIVDDVVAAVREVVPCVSEESKLFIGGLSMGGFGALRLGAKYADRFSGIAGHSSVTAFDQLSRFVVNFGAPVIDADDLSIMHWMVKNRASLPPIRFDCGIDDKLFEVNCELHAALECEGIAHEFHEFPGAHSWAYWEEHIRETLMFFNATR